MKKVIELEDDQDTIEVLCAVCHKPLFHIVYTDPDKHSARVDIKVSHINCKAEK